MSEPDGCESIPSLLSPDPGLFPSRFSGVNVLGASRHKIFCCLLQLCIASTVSTPAYENEYQTQFQNCDQTSHNQPLMLCLAQTQFGFALAFHAIPRPAKAESPKA